MKMYWKPEYYTKKEILEMDNVKLLNAYTAACCDEVKAHNSKPSVPLKLLKQIEWMRDELLTRFR